MFSMHLRGRAMACCGLILFAMSAGSGCGGGGNPPKVAKRTKTINCDQSITVYSQKPPKPESVYLCQADTLTWSKGPGVDSFTVDFGNRTPFSDGATNFTDQKPSHPGQNQYGDLDVYKYTIVVTSGTSTTKFDPQVVTGGNQ
jgi:hypothetical protein